MNGKPHPVIDGRITNVAVGGSKRTTFPMLKDENGQIKETVPDFELRVQGLVAKAKACICDLGTSRAAPVSDCTALHRRRTLPRPQPLPQPNRHHRRRPGRSARLPTARACRPSSPSTASRRQSRRSRARAAAQGTCGAAAVPVRVSLHWWPLWLTAAVASQRKQALAARMLACGAVWAPHEAVHAFPHSQTCRCWR